MAKNEEKQSLIDKLLKNRKVLAVGLAAIASVFVALFAGATYFAIRLYLIQKDAVNLEACVTEALADQDSCKTNQCSGLILDPKARCLNTCEEAANNAIGVCYREVYIED